MARKLICIVLIVLLALPVQGCWSRKELNDLAIVLAAGVDRAPGGKILLTVQIARPQAFSGGSQRTASPQENNVWVISQQGDTVVDAAHYLETKVSRSLYWGHTIILVLGEDLARDGIRQAINFFTRSPKARETVWVLVARGQASKLLNSHSQLESTSAQSIGAMIRSEAGMPVMLKDLSMILANDGINLALPRVELTPSGSPQGPGMNENIPEAGTSNGQGATKVHAETTMTGTAVFKDERLVGWLGLDETRGLLWLQGLIQKGEVTVPSPNEPGKHLSVLISRGETHIEPHYDGENIWFDVEIKMEGELAEQQSSEPLTDRAVFAVVEEETARQIELRAKQTITKAQSVFGVDIFGFGQAFHRKYKQDWAGIKDNWDELFANAEININAEAKIRRTGLTSNRLSVQQQ